MNVTAPCAKLEASTQQILITGNAAGSCHLTLMFVGGSTYEADIQIMSEWLPCGSDPHGCGQTFVASPPTLVANAECMDSGIQDAADM
jgi:hypothetical protein